MSKRVRIEEDKGEAEDEAKSSYFTSTKENLEFVSTGCTLFDCALGGGYVLGRMVNAVGDKSTAKCIKDAYVISNGEMRLIDDLGSRMPIGFTKSRRQMAVDSNTQVKATHFYKGMSKTTKIHTRHGFELEGTPDHPIMIWTPDCKFEMRPLSEVRIGDVAVIARATNAFATGLVSLQAFKAQAYSSPYAKPVSLPVCVDEDLATLIGYFVADGNFKTNSLRISNTKEWCQKEIKRICQNLGFEPRYEESGLSLGRQALVILFREIFGNPDRFVAKDKFVPEVILQSPKNVQLAFLRAYIDCDGSVGTSGTGLSITTASEKLSFQIQLMLLNIGVLSSRGSFTVPDYEQLYFRIGIWGPDCSLYADAVGSNKYKFKESNTRRSDFDSIPFLLERFRNDREIAKTLVGWSRNGRMSQREGNFPKVAFNSSNNLTYGNLETLVNAYSEISEEMNLNFYQTLIDKKYHFDPIIEIEERDEEVLVYDVHIPKTHLFWSNGFISHNTGLATEALINFLKTFPDGKAAYRETEGAYDVDYAEAMGAPVDKIDFGDEENPVVTIEAFEKDFKAFIASCTADNVPGIYVLDSFDSLSDEAEMKSDISKDSYGMVKQKKIGVMFRKLNKKIEKSRVLLIIVSQVRENINAMFGEKYRRSGGKALDFYATHIFWLAHIKTLKKTIKKVERAYGIALKAKVKKNKVGFPFREAEFEFLFGYGVDDLGASVKWLKDIGRLKDIGVSDSGYKKYLDATNALESKAYNKERRRVAKVVKTTWNEIETNFLPSRKKY